jgi:septal ring factor EnvC (AmiA/AmiB activator)
MEDLLSPVLPLLAGMLTAIAIAVKLYFRVRRLSSEAQEQDDSVKKQVKANTRMEKEQEDIRRWQQTIIDRMERQLAASQEWGEQRERRILELESELEAERNENRRLRRNADDEPTAS